MCLLLLFSYFGLLSFQPFAPKTAATWFPVSLALVGMIYTGSKALQYLSIPLVTIFKNMTIILTAYAERYIYNGSPVTSLMLFAFALMIFSSATAAYADISAGRILKDSAKDVSVTIPYLWMISNCLTTAFYVLTMKATISKVGFKDFDTVFYNKYV